VAFRWFSQVLGPLAAPTTIDLLRLQGTARFSGETLSAVYAGNRRNLGFLQDLFFQQAAIEPLGSAVAPWRLGAQLRQHAARDDLALFELPPAWSPFLPGAADIVVPAWLGARLSLPGQPAPAGRLLARDVEREADRQVRRHGFTVRYSGSPQAAREFYHEFYRPYVAARFGAQAVLVDETVFLRRCRGARLAQLLAGGEWVAGMLVLGGARTIRFGWFAMRDGVLRSGASETLDVLVIRDAWQRGVREVELGHTRPCLADGVLRYKQRLGARFQATRFPQPRLGVLLRRPHPAILDCLARQPLLGRCGTGLGAYRVENGAAGPVIALRPWPTQSSLSRE
jgi:hypothetical protein